MKAYKRDKHHCSASYIKDKGYWMRLDGYQHLGTWPSHTFTAVQSQKAVTAYFSSK